MQKPKSPYHIEVMINPVFTVLFILIQFSSEISFTFTWLLLQSTTHTFLCRLGESFMDICLANHKRSVSWCVPWFKLTSGPYRDNQPKPVLLMMLFTYLINNSAVLTIVFSINMQNLANKCSNNTYGPPKDFRHVMVLSVPYNHGITFNNSSNAGLSVDAGCVWILTDVGQT